MRIIRNPTRRLARSERGGTLVEFAFASLMLFTMVFGTIELSLAVGRSNMVSDLAQEGARWASVHGTNSSSPQNAAAVQTFVNTRALGLAVTVTTTPAPNTLTSGQTVSVTVSNDYTPMTGFIPAGLITLSSTAQMIMAR